MAFEYPGEGALDYFPCRYGPSKLLFRGPRRDLTEPYLAAFGGGETYGKFVETPWPSLVEAKLGLPVINFGYLNAGIDVFFNEPAVLGASRRAKLTVIQLMGAHNMSNRFYSVHPRRNDRFLKASNQLRSLFPEVDFAEFNFTRHLLSVLHERAPARFGAVATELRTAWVARMSSFLERMGGRKVLLWLGEYRDPSVHDPLGPEPLLLDEGLVAQISGFADVLVKVQPSVAARTTGVDGMVFGPMEELAASTMPGPAVHREIAEAITPVLSRML